MQLANQLEVGVNITACAAALGQVVADLDHLNHNTEQDFLIIGGKLAGFIETARLISSELTGFASLTSGEHAQRTSQALTSVLGRSTGMRARTEADSSLLITMRQQADRLKHTLAEFEGTASSFQALGVLTQIETARLSGSGADFGSLAADVKVAARNIRTRVKSALDTGVHLIQPIESLLRDVSALEKGQAQDLPLLISGALAGLASFRDIQNKTCEVSLRLGTRYDAISEAFTKLIVSIQFHDITRQQVEHVTEALRRLCSESRPDSGNESGDARDAVVLAVQSMQLADAGEKFAAMAASVTDNLAQIAAQVLEMADETRALSGLSSGETNSFFLQMEQGCTAILASLSHCAAAQSGIQAASGGLSGTIDQMRGPIEEIRAIETHMRRMAMNARISAFHLGAAGDALGVLAGAVQQLSSECKERSELLVGALGSLSEVTTELSSQGGAVDATGGGSQDAAQEAMRLAVAELHSSSESSFVEIAKITGRCGSLREDLSAIRQSFSVGPLFAEAVSRARGTLDGIVEETQSGFSKDDAELFEQGLADFRRHYTMQSERDVHDSVVRAAAGRLSVAELAEQPELPPKEAGALDDNVEFF